ncbi:MAG TPA: nuclear transport factor 2 family protein [Steroidobacteraceae bacterium]|nr:nuclear transport factor 2 family protein [Steroidobacteraceae bacterium]
MTGSKFEPVATRRTSLFTGAAIALALLATALASPAADAPAKGLEANKKLVVAFYDAAINRKDYAAAAAYLGPQYKQHNPTAADGAEGLKGFIDFLKARFPNQKGEIKQVIAEGDKVVLHVHSTRGDGTPGRAIVDIFRVENGKVVEHWDVIQDIPEKAANANGMF